MTIKQKLIAASLIALTFLIALSVTIHCGYNYVMSKASLANDFDKEALYLQMMLRGLNEVIINEGTPSSLRTERKGMEGFDAIHGRLLKEVRDPDIKRTITEDIDPAWKIIKRDLKPFLEHYVNLSDDKIMIEAGKLIIKTEHIIEVVDKFSDHARAVVDKNSRISAIAVKTIEFILLPLLLSAVIIAIYIYRSLIRPIGDLTRIAEGFYRGDLSIRMDELRNDEFGSMARFFNRSTAKLEKITGELRIRTGELVKVNTQLQTEIEVREKAEQDLNRQLERMKALHSFEKRMSTAYELDEILRLLINDLTFHLGIDACAILMLNDKTQRLEYSVSSGFRTDALKYSKLKLGEGNAGLAARECQVLYIADLQSDAQGYEKSVHFSKEGFVACFAVPLISKEKVKGVLELFHRSHVSAEADWMTFLETIGAQTGLAIEKAELLNDLRLSRNELLLAYDETIEGWSYALDLRDKETEGHSKRVTDMTVLIAKEFGMDNEKLLHIKRGALLHDIGKMGVPDNILLKPGALTDEEWELMKRHPEHAYTMLSKIKYLESALEIPYYHHEKWDGTGYPGGIQGKDIPLSARIFAVVDVWDALRSDRPYRPAWSRGKALEHIYSQSGTHFDPEVVAVFFDVLSKAQCDESVVR